MKRIMIILLALCLLLNGAALAEGGKGPEIPAGGAAAEIPLEEPGPDEEPEPDDGAEAELPEPAETPEPTPDPQALVTVEPPRAEGTLDYGQPLSRVGLAGGAVSVGGVEAEGMWEFVSPEEMPEPGVRDVFVRFVPVKKGWPAPEASVREAARARRGAT